MDTNKKYTHPQEDPVFRSTDFIRGQSTLFDSVQEVSRIFWVWKALTYFRLLGNYPAEWNTKYRVQELKADIEQEADKYQQQRNVGFHPDDSEEYKQFLGSRSESDRLFQEYLMHKINNNEL